MFQCGSKLGYATLNKNPNFLVGPKSGYGGLSTYTAGNIPRPLNMTGGKKSRRSKSKSKSKKKTNKKKSSRYLKKKSKHHKHTKYCKHNKKSNKKNKTRKRRGGNCGCMKGGAPKGCSLSGYSFNPGAVNNGYSALTTPTPHSSYHYN